MPTYPITPETADALHRRFTYHAPRGSQPHRFLAIREQALALAKLICTECPESPERSTALTKIDEAVMFANAAIARTENFGAAPAPGSDRHGRVDVQAAIQSMSEELDSLRRECEEALKESRQLRDETRRQAEELRSQLPECPDAAAEGAGQTPSQDNQNQEQSDADSSRPAQGT